jgi:uncharacterized LabA/DUF88 family protein
MKNNTNYANQRVGIFFDAHNLYHSAKSLHHGRLNYGEVVKYLVGNRSLIRAIAYVARSEGIATPTEGSKLASESSFFDALEGAGLELRIKDLQIFGDGSKKADWDVGIAVDAMRMASFLDVIILVTGDGDYLPLVDYLKWGLGRFVEVAAFDRSTSAKLREAADRFTTIESIPKSIIKKQVRS